MHDPASPPRRARLLSTLAAVTLPIAACTTSRAVDERTWVDLTHTFDEHTIYWPTATHRFALTVDSRGMNDKGYWYEANSFSGAEHGGTHLDSPVHFARDALTTDKVPVDRLIGPGVVVDVRAQCARDADYEVRVEDFAAWERDHGAIPAGAIVLLDTGWAARWPDAGQYLGTADRGAEAALHLHFPGLHPAAAKWLATERAIDAVGIDTASIDHGQSRLFHSHRELFKRGIPAFENVGDLAVVPATGAMIVALPMKIGGGSGGPLRIVAGLPRPGS